VSECQNWLEPRQFAEALELADRVNGWLLPREVHFLLVLAAFPTTRGAVVEIGAYHGKSTAVLAHGTRLTDHPGLVSVDPLDAVERQQNLLREKLAPLVDFRPQFSSDFWRQWRGDIRLLWNDGANDRETVSADIQAALPHLADGAIIAFHDVRNPSGERVHSFCEHVLSSPHFGVSGVCGWIGWSQYHANPETARPHREANFRLRRQLSRLGPYQDLRRKTPLNGWEKIRYKVLRWLVPSGPMTADQWAKVSRANATARTAAAAAVPPPAASRRAA
jgi:predicted O-methyltransferase YrrM